MTEPVRSKTTESVSARLRLLMWLLLPIGFGLLSVRLGPDVNWDLRNYHLYLPWSFLEGRVGHDLAPAGLQSYFNPLLDVPYFLMARSLPPIVVAFLMGALHGLSAVALLEIVRRVLPDGTKFRTAVLLTVSGCLGAIFLSELGNTMGDNSTAPLVLAGVLLLVRANALFDDDTRDVRGAVIVAGLLVGAASGLKLTNATFAVGLFAALLFTRGTSRKRFEIATVFGVAVTAGILLAAGFWYLKIYNLFGNPLYPQFNSVFGSPYATPMSLADARWGPRSVVEFLLYPFIFTVWPLRFSELPARQLLWPAAYGLLLLLGATQALAAWRRRDTRPPSPSRPALSPRARFVLLFAGVSYLAWIPIFSIGRYLVAIEVLLPLLVWVLLHRLFDERTARRLGVVAISVSVALSVLLVRRWGDMVSPLERWNKPTWVSKTVDLELPHFDKPAESTLLTIGQPIGWVLPWFPSELVFVSPETNFQTSDAYASLVDSIVKSRPAGVYAVIPVTLDTVPNFLRVNDVAQRLGIGSGDRSCAALTWLLARVPKYRTVLRDTVAANAGDCRFVPPYSSFPTVAGSLPDIVQKASGQVQRYGLSIAPTDCEPRPAVLIGKTYIYLFCTVGRNATQ
jgi:hypothetical protein